MSVASIAPSGRKETAANLTGVIIVAFLRLGDGGQYGWSKKYQTMGKYSVS